MKTVETSWEIIRALEKLDGARIKELEQELGLPPSTIHIHLATLHEEKLVTKNGHEYQLSLHFFNLGEYVKNANPLYCAGHSEVDKLAKATQEYVHLVTEECLDLIYLYEASGEQAVAKDHFKTKFKRPDVLHTSSYGKSILAHLPDEQVQHYIDERGLTQRTENTIQTEQALLQELQQIRDQGYALNDEEEVRGLRAVGVPVKNANKDVIGAISLTKPKSRMSGKEFREVVPERVMSTANVIEINLETFPTLSDQ